MVIPKNQSSGKSGKEPEIQVPDRHFRHTEPESDYSMDELDRKDDNHDDDPGFDEIRQEQDDDE